MRGITLIFSDTTETIVTDYKIDGDFDGHVEIPSDVIKIANKAFSYCTELTTIDLPERLTNIGMWAFHGCTKLKTINFSATKSLIYIGDYAFRNCKELTTIVLPEGVTNIGKYAFECAGLTTITLPESLINIGDGAFNRCSKLITIKIPKNVTCIENLTFNGCMALTNITLPESVTNIGESAFNECMALTTITLPESVTNIGESAFYKCGFETIHLPACLTYIGVKVFSNCLKLKNITLPEGVTRIEMYAFSRCTKLTTIVLPESLTYIGLKAFFGCASLTTIKLPVGVTTIASEVFSDCTKLTTIAFSENVTCIKDDAFHRCLSLTNIKLSKDLTYIGNCAFNECKSLTSIELPEGVTCIGRYAFRRCTKLTTISLPASVTLVGDEAFSFCTGLTTMAIPANGLANLKFVFGNRSSLRKIEVLIYDSHDAQEDILTRIRDLLPDSLCGMLTLVDRRSDCAPSINYARPVVDDTSKLLPQLKIKKGFPSTGEGGVGAGLRLLILACKLLEKTPLHEELQRKNIRNNIIAIINNFLDIASPGRLKENDSLLEDIHEFSKFVCVLLLNIMVVYKEEFKNAIIEIPSSGIENSFLAGCFMDENATCAQKIGVVAYFIADLYGIPMTHKHEIGEINRTSNKLLYQTEMQNRTGFHRHQFAFENIKKIMANEKVGLNEGITIAIVGAGGLAGNIFELFEGIISIVPVVEELKHDFPQVKIVVIDSDLAIQKCLISKYGFTKEQAICASIVDISKFSQFIEVCDFVIAMNVLQYIPIVGNLRKTAISNILRLLKTDNRHACALTDPYSPATKVYESKSFTYELDVRTGAIMQNYFGANKSHFLCFHPLVMRRPGHPITVLVPKEGGHVNSNHKKLGDDVSTQKEDELVDEAIISAGRSIEVPHVLEGSCKMNAKLRT